MSDKYNSTLARWVGDFNDSGDRFAVTITSKTTLYSCPPEWVTVVWRKHEDIHKEQIKSLGWLKFMILYFWYNFRCGYTYNPFEVDARRRNME